MVTSAVLVGAARMLGSNMGAPHDSMLGCRDALAACLRVPAGMLQAVMEKSA